MKKTYKTPQCKSVALSLTSLLSNSWSEDSRGEIDNNPKDQDEFGVKDNQTDDYIAW